MCVALRVSFPIFACVLIAVRSWYAAKEASDRQMSHREKELVFFKPEPVVRLQSIDQAPRHIDQGNLL